MWPFWHGFGKCPCTFGYQLSDVVEVVGHRNAILFSIQFLLNKQAVYHQPRDGVPHRRSNDHGGGNFWYKGNQYLCLLGRAWWIIQN